MFYILGKPGYEIAEATIARVAEEYAYKVRSFALSDKDWNALGRRGS